MVTGRSSAKRMRPGKQSGTGARASTEPSSESSIHQRVGSRGQDASRGGRWHPSYRDRAAQAGMARAINVELTTTYEAAENELLVVAGLIVQVLIVRGCPLAFA